jgi:PilZ domain
MEESRAAERVEIDTAIYILWGGEDSLRGGKITSLSTKGCFIQTRSEALSGQTIQVRIRLPTERWMMLAGEIKHVLRRVGFGVQFTGLGEGDASMLDLLVDYYRDDSEIVSGLLCQGDDADAAPRRKDIQRIKGGRVLLGPLEG